MYQAENEDKKPILTKGKDSKNLSVRGSSMSPIAFCLSKGGYQ